MERTVKEKKIQKRYEEEFKRQAVELVIHSGKTQAQIARELGVSGYSLNLWKRGCLKRMERAQVGSRQMSPEEMVAEIKRQQKEIEYLRRQRDRPVLGATESSSQISSPVQKLGVPGCNQRRTGTC